MACRHGVGNVRVFGSVARGEDGESSDLDLLVDPSAETSLFDLSNLKLEVEALTGLRVDLRTPQSLSVRFRDEVLREAKPL
ncbi:MAG: nucleotidyltransferase family protein [Rhodospirillales bacterium]